MPLSGGGGILSLIAPVLTGFESYAFRSFFDMAIQSYLTILKLIIKKTKGFVVHEVLTWFTIFWTVTDTQFFSKNWPIQANKYKSCGTKMVRMILKVAPWSPLNNC